jgi:hypothetical protein
MKKQETCEKMTKLSCIFGRIGLELYTLSTYPIGFIGKIYIFELHEK